MRRLLLIVVLNLGFGCVLAWALGPAQAPEAHHCTMCDCCDKYCPADGRR